MYNTTSLPLVTVTEDGGAGEELAAYYFDVAKYLWLTLGFCILVFGIFGNCLAFVALQTPQYRPHSTGFLLSALAVTDSLSLLTGLLRQWIINLPSGYDVRSTSVVSCKLHTFLTYCCQVLGSWILLVFTVDRTVSVLWPLHSKHHFPRRRVLVVWGVTTTLICAFYSQVFFIFSIDSYTHQGVTFEACNFHQVHFDTGYSETFYWIDLALFSVVPFLGIGVCNCLICARLVRMKREARQMRAPSDGEDRKHRSTIALLMTVSLVFVATTLPYGLYFATYQLFEKTTEVSQAADWLFNTCVYLLYFTNNAINFLLYCLSAERFRNALRTLASGIRQRLPCCRDAEQSPSERQRSSMTQYTSMAVTQSSNGQSGESKETSLNSA